jgi:hypothetical protein
MNSGVALVMAVVVAAVMYTVGLSFAISRRAYADWKSNRALMRARRRLFFATVFRLVGLAALVIAGGLLYLVGRDGGDGVPHLHLVPTERAPSVSVSRSHG